MAAPHPECDVESTSSLGSALTSGFLLGAGAATSALLAGKSLWIALLAYSAVGMIGTVLAAFMIVALEGMQARATAPARLKISASSS